MISLTEKNEPLEKEELEKMLKLANNGDQQARNIVIETCLKFVVHIASRYQTSDIELDDLFSIGVIGLVKGVDSYKVDKYGIKPFSTYIGRSIENEILMQIRRDKNKIRPLSFEDCINDTCIKNGKTELQLEDVLHSDEINTIDAIIRGEEVEALHKAISKLTKREQFIVKKYFGIGDVKDLSYEYYFDDYFGTNEPTLVQRQIAEHINTSRSYISRLLSNSIKKLYLELTGTPLKDKLNNNLEK